MNETNRHFDDAEFWANHRALLREYTAASAGDDDRLRLVKEAVAALDVPERTLLVAYAESGSIRKVAQIYGFSKNSPGLISKRLNVIRKKIKDYVDNHR